MAGICVGNLETAALRALLGSVCFKVVTDATHTFTPGTTALNATGITATYYDLAVMPTAGIAA